MNNNLCSKCYKEFTQKTGGIAAATDNKGSAAATGVLSEKLAQPGPSLPTAAPLIAAAPTTGEATASSSSSPSTPLATSGVSTPTLDSGASTPISTVSETMEGSLAPGERPPQVNKGRCYLCRAKIPLAKQLINKCRCEFVFCDTHKATTKHDCDFDFAKLGKDQLTKNNPKLNEKPRGGRSFTRIQ
ncbi:zinc finger domain-containing protein, partial [Lunasporangiospora selenospora]